jgi:hypothetical protein
MTSRSHHPGSALEMAGGGTMTLTYNRVIKIVEAIQRRKSAEREMPPLGTIVVLGSRDRFNKPQKPMNATP